MHARDYREIIAGSVLILIGAAVSFHAITSLGLGTLTRLGPGGFPAALGLLLVGFGIAIVIPGLGRRGEFPEVDLLALVTILASILTFAALLRPLGMVPAVIAMTMVGTRADSKLSLTRSAILAAALATAAALIFPIGLGIRVPVFAWNW